MDEALDGDGDLKKAFRTEVHNSIKGREFYIVSQKSYWGVSRIYEYGPPVRAIESKVLGFWRKHFVLKERVSVVSRPHSTPKILLERERHLDKCTIPVMMDVETRNCYRADHVLNGFLNEMIHQKDSIISPEKAKEVERVFETLPSLSDEELGAKIKEYGITRAPDTENQLSGPYPFKVIRRTDLFSSKNLPEWYIRPETAPGNFQQFNILHETNGNKLPFAIALNGLAYREEVVLNSF